MATPSMNDRPRFALRFISGKYQGGEFPLRMNREIIIGRSSDLDMVLVEDMVSRRHAKISSNEADVFIQDMGSTNGTFVNGEKIAGQALLHEGDRILVGTSIIKVVAVEGQVAVQTEAEARRRLEAGAQQRQATQGRPMSGVIEEIPLPDLLQLLSTSRKSGVLTVNNGVSLGKIYLRKGSIYFATINDDFGVSPQKAIYRMLTWLTGTFELEPSVEMQVMEEISESTEALLKRASASSTSSATSRSSCRRSARRSRYRRRSPASCASCRRPSSIRSSSCSITASCRRCSTTSRAPTSTPRRTS
jgi:pSer/pThr/pTyr-binding forkhead associated (FHA) protein